MLFGENYKQRALELYKENTANEVFIILSKEYPDKPHPSEKTLGRWKKERNEQRTVYETQTTAISGLEHRTLMTEIAEMLLDDVDKVIVVGEGEQLQDTYAIDSPESGYEEIQRNKLVAMIEGNIDEVCSKYNSWHMFNCFVPHLMAEFLPEQDYYELLNKYPGKLINALRTIVARKTFKGTCRICSEW